MINFITKNKIFISIFIGLLYIFLILWNRLIRERLPRDIFINYNNYILFAYFLLFFSSLYIVIYSLRGIFQIHAKYRILNKLIEKPFFQKIFRISADIVINYILKGPKNLYEYLYKRIKIRPIIDLLCKGIDYVSLNEREYLLYFILILKNNFNIIIVIIFVYDVFILNHLEIFYHSLPFLLIPLSFDIILFIIYNLANKNKNLIEEWMDFPVNDKKNGFNMRLKIENKDNPLLNIGDEDVLLKIMHTHYRTWFTYLYSCMTIDHFYNLENKYKPYLNIFIYSLYSIGWGYILFCIFWL